MQSIIAKNVLCAAIVAPVIAMGRMSKNSRGCLGGDRVTFRTDKCFCVGFVFVLVILAGCKSHALQRSGPAKFWQGHSRWMWCF